MKTDIYNSEVELIGNKNFHNIHPNKMLNKWVNRPKATRVAPPMKNALGIQTGNNVRIDKEPIQSIGYVWAAGNDVYHCPQNTAILSHPFYNSNGWSIAPTNFLKSMTVMGVRRVIQMTWINERDQFYIPDETVEGFRQFQHDCIIYSLFNGQNYTSSLPDIQYDGKTYDIKNQFTWFPKELIANHQFSSMALSTSANRDIKERFVQKYIEKHLHEFTPQSLRVLELGRQLVDLTMKYRSSSDPKYHLTTRWDAGWYQIRMGILHDKNIKLYDTTTSVYEEFKKEYETLRNLLRTKVYEYKFLDEEYIIPSTEIG